MNGNILQKNITVTYRVLMVMLADSCSFFLLILCIFRISNPQFINTGPTQSCASINIYKGDRQADIKRQIERKSNSIYMTRGVFVLIYTFRLSVFLSVCISLHLSVGPS